MAKKKSRKKPPTSPDRATAFARGVVADRIVAGPDVYNSCVRHLDDLENGPKRGLVWDIKAANRVIEYFPDVLVVDRVAGDNFSGDTKPFDLIDWQAFVVGSLFGWKAPDESRRFRMAFVETGKGPLALDTPVPTLGGWTMMGDIQPGDRVFDERGLPCNVTAVSPVLHDRQCYRLRFSDGCEIVADAAHEWRVASLRTGGKPGPKPAGAPRKGGYATRNTAEIARTLVMGPTTSAHPQAKWNHRVDVSGPLNLPDAEIPVPPYTFGAWLGDGDSDCARLTVAYADWGIVEEVRSEGVPVAEQKKHSDTTARVVLGGDRSQVARNGSVQARLRALNVLGNKHIPAVYLRASDGQRLALLQGLMDTDGSALKEGAAELTICREPLVRDALELMRSLGFKPTVTESAAMLNGREVGRRWRIRLHAYRDRPIFRLHRKAARLRGRPSTRSLSEGRMIVGCDPVPSVPVRCLTVDSPSHLFLAGEGMIPTHNSGKSPMAAGVGLYMLTADGESRAEVYAAATKRDQAKVLFRDAVAMVNASPELDELLHMSGGTEKHNIAYLRKGSFFRPISTDDRGKGQSGPRPHCALLDEIHEHPTNAMVEIMRAGTKGRRQALIFMITNSGSDRESVCYNYHDYAVKVCAGDIEDDSFFAFVCSLDEDDDPLHDPSCWPKANPSLGITFQPKYLEEQVRHALGMPSKQNLVLRLNFCRWTDAESAWIGHDAWVACERELDREAFRGRKCYGALDLSGRRDLTAYAEVFPNDDGTLDAFVEFWTPKDTLKEREDQDRAPYLKWAQDGHLHAIPGKVIDYAHVVKRLGERSAEVEIAETAYDRWRIENLKADLDEQGVDLNLVECGQGFKDMSPAVEAIEEVILNGTLRVHINPVLRWNVASAVLEEDAAGNRKFTKRKATGRIDGVVALAMAVRLAMLNQEKPIEPFVMWA